MPTGRLWTLISDNNLTWPSASFMKQMLRVTTSVLRCTDTTAYFCFVFFCFFMRSTHLQRMSKQMSILKKKKRKVSTSRGAVTLNLCCVKINLVCVPSALMCVCLLKYLIPLSPSENSCNNRTLTESQSDQPSTLTPVRFHHSVCFNPHFTLNDQIGEIVVWIFHDSGAHFNLISPVFLVNMMW